jgi:thiol-disulfide isomerase/thioredoxin/NAD-dependent dihydropyrimidine dehydrogenase PreA subunit
MVSIVVGSVFAFRLFCRFLCPLGGLYGLFNKISVFGIKLEQPKCIDCGKCLSHCKVDIRHVGDQECISCGECIDVCPTQAISFKGGRIFLKENEVTEASPVRQKRRKILRIITAALMAAVLIGALWGYWNAAEIDTAPVNAERGNQIGDLCYDYDLQIIDAAGIRTETIDPTDTGKVTIVNFWGTWCTPCVNELPYFDQIASDYADSVTVIAIHTHSVVDTAPDYIASHYPDSKLIFAKDYPIDEIGLVGGYYSSLGGRGTFPYTVVLDENGIIVSIFVNSLEYEDLLEVVQTQLSS